jgi:hypothetical protein
MLDDSDSWDFDRSYDRDQNREPQHPTPRPRPPLSERGSVKQATLPRLRCTAERHQMLRNDPVAWSALRLNGFSLIEAFENEPAYAVETRTCPMCRSTVSKVR